MIHKERKNIGRICRKQVMEPQAVASKRCMYAFWRSKWKQLLVYNSTCFCGRSITESLESATAIWAPPRSPRVSADLTSTALVGLASLITCWQMQNMFVSHYDPCQSQELEPLLIIIFSIIWLKEMNQDIPTE